jgi:replicative DNA helicase
MERLPPQDINAEAGVIGSMLIDPLCIPGVCEIISEADFFKDSHRTIFAVIVELVNAGTPVDGMLVLSALKTKGLIEGIGGQAYLEELVTSVPSSAHAEHYAAIVREKAKRRSLLIACHMAMRDAYESPENSAVIIEAHEQRLAPLSPRSSNAGKATLTETLHEVFAAMERPPDCVPTGFVELDGLLAGGLWRGESIILAARPSVGKTAFAFTVALNVAKRPGALPVLAFSLEMGKQQLAQRLLAMESGVDMQKVRRGMLAGTDKADIRDAVGVLTRCPIIIDDSPGLTVPKMRATARQQMRETGISMVIVDYLQLVEAPGEHREQVVASISRGVKQMARELNVPVVTLSQLNRESEKEGRRPRMSDLRESGAIEQDADTILMLHREDVAHRGDQEWFDANPDKINVAELNVTKQRNGPCDGCRLAFVANRTMFATYNPGV